MSEVGRSPYGERGLKLKLRRIECNPPGRSPYGERGLKFRPDRGRSGRIRPSLSLRRAWIEITTNTSKRSKNASLSLRRAWIEIFLTPAERDHPGRSPYGERGLKFRQGRRTTEGSRSLSLRRAWIEISTTRRDGRWPPSLSLRRAWIEIIFRPFAIAPPIVALLTESVD